MNKIAPITLMLLSSLLGYAYQVTVTGIVVGPGGNGISEAQVLIYSSPNDGFAYEKIVLTDEEGRFEDVIEINDDLSKGVLLLSLVDCPNRQRKRIVFNRNHLEHKVKLQSCRSDRPSCDVKIRIERMDSAMLRLVAVTHGPGPFEYLWSTGDTTKEVIVSALEEYCVEVASADGCTDQACLDLASDSCGVEIHVSRADANIFQGFAILHARVNGHGPFSYQWSSGQTSKNIRVQESGEYCVSITDALGCASSNCVVVALESDCKTEIEVTRPDSGSALLSVQTKGAAPFQYAWSTGDTTMTIVVDPSGRYCVKVIDSTGCVSYDCVDFDHRQCAVKISAKRTDKMRDSTTTLTTRVRGQAPFSYMWNTGDTTREIQVSEEGEYCVVVVDAFGCESKDCIKIGTRDQCKTEIQITPGTNLADARFALIARTKGQGPFTYLWSTGETTQSILPAENVEYCVEVIDAAGCTSSDCIDLGLHPDTCSTEIKGTPNGLLIALTRGGPPAKYLWSTGDTTKHIRIEQGGEYCVTVTSIFGCESSDCIVVDGVNDMRCRVKIFRKRADDHRVILTARVDGMSDYEFLWSTGDTTQSITVDSSGEYCVSAFNNLCKVEDCIKLNFGNASGLLIGDINNTAAGTKKRVRYDVSPNPFGDNLNLNVLSERGGRMNVSIISVDGRPIMQRTLEVSAGQNRVAFELSDLRPGYYFLKIADEIKIETIKIIKS